MSYQFLWLSSVGPPWSIVSRLFPAVALTSVLVFPTISPPSSVVLQLLLGLPPATPLSVWVPTQFFVCYGRGILPRFMSSILPFLQLCSHCHWFVLCTPPQCFIKEHIRPIYVKYFAKAPVYKCPAPYDSLIGCYSVSFMLHMVYNCNAQWQHYLLRHE